MRTPEYPRSFSLVLKDKFVITAADVFNRRNERVKHYEVRRLEQVDGIWTALDVGHVQRSATDAHRADVVTIDYNVGLTEQDFSRRSSSREGPPEAALAGRPRSARFLIYRFRFRWRLIVASSRCCR